MKARVPWWGAYTTWVQVDIANVDWYDMCEDEGDKNMDNGNWYTFTKPSPKQDRYALSIPRVAKEMMGQKKRKETVFKAMSKQGPILPRPHD